MKKQKLLPLIISLAAAGMLAGCLDSKNETNSTKTTNTPVLQENQDKIVSNDDAKPVKVEETKATEEVKQEETTKPEAQQDAQTTTTSSGLTVLSEALPENFFAPLVEGKDYIKVAIDPNKNLIEASYDKPLIVDFFWYGCGHCNKMRPMMTSLENTHPEFKVVKYPAAFPNWDSGTKLYLAYQELGIFDKMHDITFEMLHKQHRNLLGNREQLESFLKEEKVDLEKFIAAENGFNVSRQLLKAKEVTAQYNLASTPTMGVYYKGFAYLVNPSLVGGYDKTANNIKIMLDKFTPEQVAGSTPEVKEEVKPEKVEKKEEKPSKNHKK